MAPKPTTLGIPYRQYSILSRWATEVDPSQAARFAASLAAKQNPFETLSTLDLHQKGAEICTWILIRHPGIEDDMDDGEEEPDWKDLAFIEGAQIKYAPNAWRDHGMIEVYDAAFQIKEELERRYYPGEGPHDVSKIRT
ncbi:hypothetical protein P7C70_g3154, partial [Phenoliferia sp. Uapishka_3]